MNVLGISGFYHDAAAALVRDGAIVAAAQQERFSRVKHDPSFPAEAIAQCLAIGDVGPGELDAVAFYDKPIPSVVRALTSLAAAGPRGLRATPTALPRLVSRRLPIAYRVERGITDLGYEMPADVFFAEHHVSHAAAAFYPSPFERAAILTFDGVGEWAVSSIGVGHGSQVELLEEVRFPDSLGLLYSAFTYQAGFKVNSGEYKLMGLAPYGEPTYRDQILDTLIDLDDDGSFVLDLRYVDFLAGSTMTNDRFSDLFGGPPRHPDAPITKRERDLARSVQDVTEEIVLRMARHAHELTGEADVVLGGGVALNCVATGRLQREGPFERVWVQPAAGDAGSAIGCALWAWHQVLDHPRPTPTTDAMAGCFLGPAFDADAIAAELAAAGRPAERITDPAERARRVAGLLADGGIVGVFQGRMEFGPRALGNRSILADPRGDDTRDRINETVKRRESFRPFAPAVLAEHADDWFDLADESPYMGFAVPVAARRRVAASDGAAGAVTSVIPAVTHVDGTARVQTVDAARNPRFHELLRAFADLTGCPVLVNTSLNVRGEPIAATPDDAYRCFMTTQMDWLVLEDCVLDRREQPPWTDEVPSFEPD